MKTSIKAGSVRLPAYSDSRLPMIIDRLNEYAEDITKSYDFSDDYDCKTQTYKHLPEDTIVNLLGFALIQARDYYGDS